MISPYGIVNCRLPIADFASTNFQRPEPLLMFDFSLSIEDSVRSSSNRPIKNQQ
jgi:hypothetical protein